MDAGEEQELSRQQEEATRAGARATALGAAVLLLAWIPGAHLLARAGLPAPTGLAGFHGAVAVVLLGVVFLFRLLRPVPAIALAHGIFGLGSLALGLVIAGAGGPAGAAVALVALPLVTWAALIPGGASTALGGAVTILAGALGPSLVRPELVDGTAALLGIAGCAQGAVVLLAVAAFAERNRLLQGSALVALARAAERDPLTGLGNRRPVDAALALRRPGSVMVFDLDRFKAINDTLGHAAGDEVLREVAARLGSVLRRADALGRVGGEEFVAVLHGVRPAEAARIAERARRAVAGRPVLVAGRKVRVTVSAGVAPLRGDGTLSLGNADAALYRAKAGGRDRVELAVVQPDGSVGERQPREEPCSARPGEGPGPFSRAA